MDQFKIEYCNSPVGEKARISKVTIKLMMLVVCKNVEANLPKSGLKTMARKVRVIMDDGAGALGELDDRAFLEFSI